MEWMRRLTNVRFVSSPWHSSTARNGKLSGLQAIKKGDQLAAPSSASGMLCLIGQVFKVAKHAQCSKLIKRHFRTRLLIKIAHGDVLEMNP